MVGTGHKVWCDRGHEFEKQLVKAQDFMEFTNQFRRIHGIYLTLVKGKPNNGNM
jgi:hypothetical protein